MNAVRAKQRPGKGDLLRVTDRPIVPEKVISGVTWDDCGALVTFSGRVRGRSGGKRVLSLEHRLPAGEERKTLRQIAAEMRERWSLGRIALCFRSGPVPAGEVTVVVVVSATHRQEAFAACQYAIDRFKAVVSAKEIEEDG